MRGLHCWCRRPLQRNVTLCLQHCLSLSCNTHPVCFTYATSTFFWNGLTPLTYCTTCRIIQDTIVCPFSTGFLPSFIIWATNSIIRQIPLVPGLVLLPSAASWRPCTGPVVTEPSIYRTCGQVLSLFLSFFLTYQSGESRHYHTEKKTCLYSLVK